MSESIPPRNDESMDKMSRERRERFFRNDVTREFRRKEVSYVRVIYIYKYVCVSFDH